MPTTFNDPDVSAAVLLAALRRHQAEAREDLHLNPAARLAAELFRSLEGKALSVEGLRSAAQTLSNEAFERRVQRFHERRAGAPSLADTLSQLAGRGFDAFRAAVERAGAGVVFTAHPTFALGVAKRELAARYPLNSDDEARAAWRRELADLDGAPSDDISLRYEHHEAQKALGHARAALRTLNAAILGEARKRFPQQWTSLQPNPVSLATWVGYDLDGRSDIHWGETIRIRLAEKAAQLERYAEQLDGIVKRWPDSDLRRLHESLKAAATLAQRQADAFAGDLDDPAQVVAAANLLTAKHKSRMVSLSDAAALLTGKLKEAEASDLRSEIMLLRAEMDACGLGAARIHLRVNAAQVRSALKADLGLDPDTGFLGRSALDVAARKSTSAQHRDINFGSVFLEKMTARRQFMLCAQILKHIDADTPIRFLIAECEAPATVMGAVYLARLYGVEEKIDISPLFETPQALEGGGRFLERLLSEHEYRDYVSLRGRICIQLGFSDSGRFMGQCAAGLAIERLQVLFARALEKAGLTGLEALVFNTHGESMGRGAHSGDFASRLDHLATPWARSRFARAGIRLAEECSFQGGEGYLHFQTEDLAAHTLQMVWSGMTAQNTADQNDRFYEDINYSWDVYRGLKAWQELLFQNRDYRVALAGFAQRFLYKTGSRQAKRARSGGFEVSALRAIPHNAILQQLGAPVNVSGGMGAAAGREMERFRDHVNGSARMQATVALAAHARALTDLSLLRAYAAILTPGYWSQLAMAADDETVAERYEAAQEALDGAETAQAFDRLAVFLAQDLRKFDSYLKSAPAPVADEQHATLAVLHAVRQALMARAVSLTASAPAFSPRHDIEQRDLVRMAFDWRLEEAADLLADIFPSRASETSDFDGLEEQVEDHAFEGGAYPEVHEQIIQPLREIAAISSVISQAIAHHYDAFG